MPGLLKRKKALVTAASGERGASIARELAREGCAVAIHYFKNPDSIEKLRRDLEKTGCRAFVCQADLSSPEQIELLFANLYTSLGPLDILVNNAHAEITRKPFVETGWDDFQRQLDVALKGSLLACGHFIKQKNPPGKRSIIQVLSSQMNQPVQGYSSLSASLSALAGFSKSLALEVGPMGVRVNSIAPGFTKTGKTPHAPQGVREKIIRNTPLGRLAAPEDIAKAVLFFASDLSEFITGECLTVDGGRFMVGD